MTNKILTANEDGVFRVRFNNPEKKNALLPEMYIALNEAFDTFNEDKTCRVMVLEGEGDAFTSGNNMASFLMLQNADPEAENPTLNLMKKAATCEKPLIAAVNGPAVGLGTTLLFSFDLIYAAESAFFLTPFVNLGIVPEAGTTRLMPQALGWQAASEFLLTGEKISAQRADEMGLVNKILAPEELEAYALEKARLIASKPPSSMRHTKRLMKGDQSSLLQLMDEEMKVIAECGKSDEMKEAVSAFLEKRPPDFSKF